MVFQKTTGRATPPSYRALIDYFTLVDPAIRVSRYALRPAKSVEYGKVDQPMLSHVRNGVWAMVELNARLSEMGSDAVLSSEELRETVALFAVHDLHKCVGKEWKEQFDLSAEHVHMVAAEFRLTEYAPALTPIDYQSIAVALHSKCGYHADLSQKFTDYLRWLKLADALAGLERPRVTDSMRQALDYIDPSLSFYYHRFQESTGILSNLVHTGVAEWAKKKGLYPFLIFENGVLYIGSKGIDLEVPGRETVTEIYREFEHVLNSCHAAISNPAEFSQSITVQGSKGLYSIDEASFFYSGIPTVMKGFMAAAVLREESESKEQIEIDLAHHKLQVRKAEPEMQHPPLDVIDIPGMVISEIQVDGVAVDPADVEILCRPSQQARPKYPLVPESVRLDGQAVEGTRVTITGPGLFASQVGYRHHLREDFGIDIGWDARIISYARAISGLRKAIIDPLIVAHALPTDDAILEICRLFQVDENMTRRMAGYARNHRGKDHHAVGGFWNYSYAIARLLLNSSPDGVRFADLTADRKIDYLTSLVDSFLSSIPAETIGSFKAGLLYPYQDKFLVWFAENLDLNGSMAFGVFENKVSKFDAYCRGKGICHLTADTPFDNEKKTPSKDVSMLGYSFSNHAVLGGTEPKLSVSVPVEVELGLRRIGHQIKKGEDKLYFRLIPDYFHTPLVARIFSDLLSRFNAGAMTNIRALAVQVLSRSTPDTTALVRELFAEAGGRGLFRYAGTDFTAFNSTLYTTYDVVFNKMKDNETEYWFFGAYLGMLLATATGCRVVVGENPICMTGGDEFNEMVLLEAPHAAVKRIFQDTIPLSRLPSDLRLASLVVALGYEYALEDKWFPKHLQTLRNHLFPGSTLLKVLWRKNSENEGQTGAFINRLRGYSMQSGMRVYNQPVSLLEWAIELDQIAGDHMTIQTLHELARLGMNVAIPKGFEPHKIERLLRESVRAILTRGTQQYQREDYVDVVMGRLLKMMKRAGDDQFIRIDGWFHPNLTQAFAESFVDYVFYGLFGGNAGKLKRAENDLADGFYAATLQLREQRYPRKTAEQSTDVEQNKPVEGGM
ncbi:MAG: CRISPR-associated protein Csc3 [Methanocalculus sp. 52_23]|nr:MAG: CRISPR-associated protein Csc3 [Methanocalculus sp. 52_23]